MSGIWGKHRRHLPLNGSSDSQVIGRGGCDSGLLGHACACARVLMCMLGCLSNLVVVGFFKEKTFPLAVARTGAVLCLPLNPPLPPSLVLLPQGWGRNTVYRWRLRALLCRKSIAGLWREVQLYSWPCSFMVPLPCASCTCCCLLGSDRKAGLRSLQWVEALVAGPACRLPLPLGYTGA